MNRLSAFFAVGLILTLTVSPGASATTVDAREFFKSIAGKYEIALHGGIAPHSNSPGKVEDQGNQGYMEMGYCFPGGCDNGWMDFPYETTTIDRVDLAPNRPLFKISTVAEGVTYKYEWEEQENQILFRRLEYPFVSGQVGTLEYVLSRRLSPEDTTPVAVDSIQFFQTRVGNYKVELIAGEKPHVNEIGKVEDLTSDGEALVTLGYCDEKLGFCDIGYRDFPYKTTTVSDTEISATRHVFKITVSGDEGDTPRVYEWEEEGDRVIFRSLNYPLPNGSVMPVLEHVITKLPN